MAVEEEENEAPYQEECLRREKCGGEGGLGNSKKEERGRREEMDGKKRLGGIGREMTRSRARTKWRRNRGRRQ